VPVPVRPHVLCIVGPPKAAKSDLISRLVEALVSRGLRIGVVKRHAHPGFEVDRDGKDSRRYYQAGAAGVIISAPDKLALIARHVREMPLDEVVERFFADTDLVLADGYARSSAPRVIVCASARDVKDFEGEGEVVVLVDASEGGELQESDVMQVAAAIRERFGL